MAVTQENVLQQPPEAVQPGQAPIPTTGTQATTNGQAPSPASTMQEPADNADHGQAPGAELDFSQVLEQQIAQAIQPVLDEFRQNMTQTIEQQRTELASSTPTSPSAGGPLQGMAQGQGTQQPAQQQATAPIGQQPQGQAPQQAQTPQVSPQPAQQLQQAQQPVQATGTASAGQAAGQLASQGQQALQAPATGALQPALEAVGRQGEHWLQSLLVAGLTALLTESTHAAVQQRAEQGLHVLLVKLFEAVPEGKSNQEMQNKTERTLQVILRESLDAVFAQSMRATVQQGGQQAIQESFHGDFGGAVRKLEDTLRAMVDALLTVLRRQWQTVLRLLVALALLALESSLAQSNTKQQAAAAS